MLLPLLLPIKEGEGKALGKQSSNKGRQNQNTGFTLLLVQGVTVT